MKWRKAFDRPLPEIKNRGRLSIKYKGTPHVLVYYHGHWYWEAEEFTDFPLHKESLSAIEWLDESPSLPSSSVTGEEVNKKMKEAIETLLTAIEFVAFEHSAVYAITTNDIIMLKDAVASLPVTGESEAIERDRNTQYTYYHVDFNNCPSFDGDYMICESIEEIKGLLELVDADLDDPLTKCSVEIKGVGMTPNEYAEWFNENI